VRVIMPMIRPPVAPGVALVGAALAWSAAFALYLWRFGPWLMAARLDGQDG
jgi:uncharacterized protein involved in response to NO